MHDMNEKGQLLVSAHLVDARGKACPAPIIELAKAFDRDSGVFSRVKLLTD